MGFARICVPFLHGGLFVLDDNRREAIVAELTEALASFTDVDGDRVVDETYRADAVYEGPHRDAGPDLIPVANDHKLLGFSGDGSLFDFEDDWIAAHEMEGVFVANGPDFASGRDVAISLYDVSPTLLHVLDHAVPEDMDGDVRQDLLLGKRAQGGVRTCSPKSPAHEANLTDEDKERMNERLKQLGYID